MSDPDVVIIGAGAAGIGAGLELQARGIPFVILEASHRVGGRAFTDSSSLPYAWDQGCHWLHCANENPLVAWADRLGAVYERQTRVDHFIAWIGGSWAGAALLAEARAQLLAAYGAIDGAAARGHDVSIEDALPKGGRWVHAVRYYLGLMASEDPTQVSASGYADYAETGVDWPVVTGYGDLIQRMAAGLPIRTGTHVTGIGQGPAGVRIKSAQGTIDAKAAIVTVSTNVLASGAITFGAGPARDLLDLIADIPCGSYEKVAFALDRRLVDDDARLFCMTDPGDGSTPLDFQIAPRRQPMMFAHLAGSTARELTRQGNAAMADFATRRLVAAFGSDARKRIVSVAATGWQDNPFVLGGYSYSKPGLAHKRHEMIAADTGNVAFAGEAFSRRWQATAHGAYQSGRDAAARLAKGLAPA